MTESQNRDFSYLIPGGEVKLSDHQNRAIAQMIAHKAITLAFQPGLGKTLTSLVASKYFIDKYPEKATCLIMSPRSARNAFVKELSKKLKVDYAIYTADYVVEYSGQPYVLIEHSVMDRYLGVIENIVSTRKTIGIVDEAHFLRADNSKLTKLFNEIKSRFTVLYLLTATPLGNDFMELYNFMKIMDPKIPDWFKFRNYFCYTKQRTIRTRTKSGRKIERRVFDITGYKNLDVLKKYISDFMIFGSRAYNLSHRTIEVSLDDYLKEPYIQAAKGLLQTEFGSMEYSASDEDEEEQKEKSFGGRLHDLQKIVDNCHESCARKALSNKELALMRLLDEIMKRNESALIFVLYDDSVDRMKEILEKNRKILGINKIHVLTGKTKEQDRAKIEVELSEREVVILTQAGRQSRNLQQANNLIFYDQSFSTSDYIQIMGRITRTDTKFKTMNSYVICVKNTIDEYKKKVFEDNAWVIKEIFGNYGNAIPLCLHKIDHYNESMIKKQFLWKLDKDSF